MPNAFVVDTNVLFSFFRKESDTRALIISGACELTSPERSLEELKEHEGELLAKSRINPTELEAALALLQEIVTFVPVTSYASHLPNAVLLAEAFIGKEKEDILDDADFLALALKKGCPLWSEDRLLKKQGKVRVFSTSEVLIRFM